MITLTIDNQKVQVPAGTTVLEAAEKLGIAIPTLCHKQGFEPSAGCMVCVVQISGFSWLMPSCGTPAEEGMAVQTGTNEVNLARRAALELLLSDHIGDCEGPCRLGCPANMDIPRMIRFIAEGRADKAIEIIRRDIALPAVLGRICPAPCEKVCRRAAQDAPVSIRLLKRFAADADLDAPAPYRPVCKKPTGRNVAIVGAGPCGLSAAYYLAQKGHRCVLLEKNDQPGGMLRCAELKEKLPSQILDREISRIMDLGVQLQGGRELGRDFSLERLQKEFDAVFLAIGQPDHRPPLRLPLEMNEKKIVADRRTFRTSLEGVFAGGGALSSRRMCVKSVADGKEAAEAIDQFLRGQPPTGFQKEFNSRLGTLTKEEWKVFVNGADPQGRLEPDSPGGGFTALQAQSQARRCLHCDCRKKKNCKLRKLSTELKAVSGTYSGQRRGYSRIDDHPEAIFESGKCIRCGLCIQVLRRAGLGKGLTFRGRGFGVQIAAALDGPILQTAAEAARQCVQVCPTGAWSLKSK